MKQYSEKRKAIFEYLLVFAGVVIVIAVAIGIILGPINLITKVKNHETINSMQYEAIEINGVRYYPITTPLDWIPVSLPPQGEVVVNKVVNGVTEPSEEYRAQTFIDDYKMNYLYMDGLVFQKKARSD